ncbi:rRNA maturation RNase YbeY [Tepidibacillus fermentans]|uniref:Endoribonuclease YbeY n=1 Tax=Tepidibacillus fermentans TaxID=1281767 RepID=A0A4R3KJ80_9BACI|nr:rRNA maturation RNase YbeY [Tepidibacillus fermentans]TCS83726.1 putative rRNA maturation factor [Tepidibacillus fermentans]
MIEVEILNEQEEKELTESQLQLIEKVIQEAARLENITNGEVVISLVDDRKIHELNKSYRGIDRPTDVLSFAIHEKGEDEPDIIFTENLELPNMFGDIVISIPRVIEQANDYGHSFERELSFLTVHGFLHLLGYDHGTSDDEKVMFSKQEEVLQRLNITR